MNNTSCKKAALACLDQNPDGTMKWLPVERLWKLWHGTTMQEINHEWHYLEYLKDSINECKDNLFLDHFVQMVTAESLKRELSLYDSWRKKLKRWIHSWAHLDH